MAPTLVIDSLSILYRSFFALPPLTTSRGEPTSGLYGFCAVTIKVWREHKPAAGVFARDLPRPTFRHERYAAYKQNRGAPPDTLRAQLDRFDDVLRAFGFPVLSAAGYEADDVIATLSTALPESIVVTGDHDCLQLVSDLCRVLIVSRATVKDTLYDAAAVERAYGVSPAQIPDWIALVGDPSDNLPGVTGIGDKTAARLIQTFGGVGDILARIDEVTPMRVRQALIDTEADLRVWRDLARLRYDVPLPAEPHAAPLDDDARERLRVLFEALEFRSLLPRLAEL